VNLVALELDLSTELGIMPRSCDITTDLVILSGAATSNLQTFAVDTKAVEVSERAKR
jgi:hypothetical protein